VSGHSLKLHFCMFERSKVKQSSLNCWEKFVIFFPLIAKFTSSKFDKNKKCFFMFKTLKPQEWTIIVFFKCPFFFNKCAPFHLKIGEDFKHWWLKGTKTLIDEICFYNPFEHIWFKITFDLKNYGFYKCSFNKSCS
jgi:hypothetical protein